MATTKFYFDTRAVRTNGTYPLKLSLSRKGRTALISLGVSLLPGQWDFVRCKIKGVPNAAALNAFIFQRKQEIDSALLAMMQEGGGIASMGVVQLRDCLMERAGLVKSENAEGYSMKDGCSVEKERGGGFSEAFRSFTATKEKRSTRGLYEQTLKHLERFCPDLERLSFGEITREWLTGFDRFLSRTAPSRNARNIYLRNVRAVFNWAIDEGLTEAYPFRRFRIKAEATRKRSLPVEDLRLLLGFDVEEHQRQYLDMFKLVFLLMGINVVDLLNLRPRDLAGGRIEYYRAKTGRLYDIKVEPEAMEIIDKYRGKGYLLDVMDRYRDYRSYGNRLNRNLQQIGRVEVGKWGKKVRRPLFPGITTYWARHSWATVAASLDIPKETIAHALGHGGNTVTDIYIDFDQRKVDEANRRVIDWVLYGKR